MSPRAEPGRARVESIPGPALFYCRTPLQAMIVNRLAERVEGRTVALYHPTTPSPKHAAYFERLHVDERHFVPYVVPRRSDTLTETLTWLRIPARLRRASFGSLFVASVGSIPFGMLATRNPSARLYTFDDGTFNLSEAVYPKWIAAEPAARRLAKILVRGSSNPAVMGRAQAHFTIFPAEFVVGSHRDIVEVDVFGAAASDASLTPAGRRRVRVLLGSWFHDQGHQAAHDKLVAYSRFDLFLPHPADPRPATCAPWLGALIPPETFGQRVAEDVIGELHRAGLRPVVFGFDSTALYNVARHTLVVSLLAGGGPPHVVSAVAAAMGVRQVRCLAT